MAFGMIVDVMSRSHIWEEKNLELASISLELYDEKRSRGKRYLL